MIKQNTNNESSFTLRRFDHPADASRLIIEEVPYRKQRLDMLAAYVGKGRAVETIVNGERIEPAARRKRRVAPGDSVDILPAVGALDLLAYYYALVQLGYQNDVPEFLGVNLLGVGYLGGRLMNEEAKETVDPAYSQNYAFDPHTTGREGLAIPRCWGRTMSVGNVIAKWTEPYSLDAAKEVLYAIACFGEGPIKGRINDETWVNDQPAGNFNNTTLIDRLGTLNQSCMPGFEKLKLQYNLKWKLNHDEGWYTWTTPNKFFDDIEITFETTLQYYRESGKAGVVSVFYTIEISVKGAGSWTRLWDRASYTDFNPYPRYRQVKLSENEAGFTISRGTQYDIRIRKDSHESTSDRVKTDLTLRSVREVVDVAFQYPGKDLLGIICVGSEQLSGDLDIKRVAEHRVVHTYNGTKWSITYSNNRAWCVLDELLQPVVVGDADANYQVVRYEGFHPDRIDLALFYEWAQWCDDQVTDGNGGTEDRMPCNFNADAETDVFSLAQELSVPGRMNLYWSGRTLTGWIDKAVATVSGLITCDNILPGSWKNIWPNVTELAGRLEVAYRSAVEGYERRTLPLYVSDAGPYNRTVKIEAVGADKLSLATRIGNHFLYRNKLIRNRNRFSLKKDATPLQVGQVVRVANRTPSWGKSYKVVQCLGADSVRVDRRVEATAGDAVYLRYYDPATETIKVGTYTLAGIDQDELTITTTWDIEPLADWLIAVGPAVLRRVIKVEIQPDHTFDLEVETYTTDLFDVDAIEPDNSMVDYSHTRSIKTLDPPLTRQDVIDLVSPAIPMELNVNTPVLGNITWSGNGSDTVRWKETTAGSSLQFTYQGTVYPIAFSETTDEFIYWDPADPNVFSSTDDPAVLRAAIAPSVGGWYVCRNVSGVPYPVQPFQILWAGVLQAGSITAGLALIADAAIDTAQIADAAIETAKINDLNVTTLKIADEAVTKATSAYTAGAQGISNSSATTVATAAITTTGSQIHLSFTCTVYTSHASGDNLTTVQIVRDTTTVLNDTYYKPIATSRSIQIALSFDETPSAAAHTYYVKLLCQQGSSYTSAYFSSLKVEETKK